MQRRDYNGTDRWTVEAVQERYADYAARYGVAIPSKPVPKTYANGDGIWTYPIMESVIAGIERGDLACLVLGVDFILEDRKFPFGRLLKARTARALRRAAIPNSQVHRIRKRILDMLWKGNVPREYREYAKLLRKIGLGEEWRKAQTRPPISNKYAMRYFAYFQAVRDSSPAVQRRVP